MPHRNYLLLLCLLALLCYPDDLSAQIIYGKVTNDLGEPVPYANIFIRELSDGTVSDDEGFYQFRLETEGRYQLVFSSLGYETKAIDAAFTGDSLLLNVQLATSGVQLKEITVNAAKRDPAFGIIRKVIENKEQHLKSFGSYRTVVYLKAIERIDRKEKEKRKREKPLLEVDALPDPFEEQQKEDQQLVASLNLIEMQATLSYQYPNKYKEERTAFQRYGSGAGLFVPRFAETDFNFYRNLVRLNRIADAPIISPLSNNAILSYKYQLLSTDLEGDQIVYKIKVIPRKAGNSTCKGILYINEGSWTINRLELSFAKDGLMVFDEFTLQQRYEKTTLGSWIIGQQIFSYTTKEGKRTTYQGSTTIDYSDYEENYAFPPKFFNNEVAVTTQEAYERDSSYWQSTRTAALSAEETRMIAYRDSVKAVRESKAYQDSITARYNKINFMEVVWDGVGFRNNEKKSHLYVGSIPELINFSIVGGFRIGPSLYYNRLFPSGRRINLSTNLTYGFLNKDIQGDVSGWFRCNPFKWGDVWASTGRSFRLINPYDAFLNQLKASNYYLYDAVTAGHHIELVNGLYIRNELSRNTRRPIDGLRTSSFVEDLVEDDGELLKFDPFQAFLTLTVLYFTPAQRYMREPNRKIVLGSKWPTFSLLHRKGWRGILGSDIDFDYLEFAIEQNVILGALGNSRYRAQVGKFINTKDLRFVDVKQFRESDPILYTDPLNNFQAIDTSLTTSDLFVEFHHIHHFNGALINNIPLLKKSKLRAVAGGGFVWLRENDYRYQELFAGFERVFKINARRRMRIGLYAVVGDSNIAAPITTYKISFDLIDTWKRNWSF
ncbi:MAG: DUF5686 and carboxypeptidase regulatory-like domain-containing protein [Bacteroidota bacterium]